MSSRNFEIAVQAARRGDQARAYNYMRAAILEDPTFAPAWFWMSTLVSDPERKRECLQHGLALDPTYKSLGDDTEYLRIRSLVASFRAPIFAEQRPSEQRKLGEYLVERGLITAQQLEEALAEQRAAAREGRRAPLGRILLRMKVVTPLMLATALIAQQREAARPPERLGEYLVSHGLITVEQLKLALAEQLIRLQQGERIRLGELLINSGMLKQGDLERILEEQQTDAMSSFQ